MRIRTVAEGRVKVSSTETTVYPADRNFNVDEATAQILYDQGALDVDLDEAALEPVKPEGEVLTAAIVDAIAGLSKDDSDDWTNDGKPNAKALSSALGYSVSAAERDAAWAAVEAKSTAKKAADDGQTSLPGTS